MSFNDLASFDPDAPLNIEDFGVLPEELITTAADEDPYVASENETVLNVETSALMRGAQLAAFAVGKGATGLCLVEVTENGVTFRTHNYAAFVKFSVRFSRAPQNISGTLRFTIPFSSLNNSLVGNTPFVRMVFDKTKHIFSVVLGPFKRSIQAGKADLFIAPAVSDERFIGRLGLEDLTTTKHALAFVSRFVDQSSERFDAIVYANGHFISRSDTAIAVAEATCLPAELTGIPLQRVEAFITAIERLDDGTAMAVAGHHFVFACERLTFAFEMAKASKTSADLIDDLLSAPTKQRILIPNTEFASALFQVQHTASAARPGGNSEKPIGTIELLTMEIDPAGDCIVSTLNQENERTQRKISVGKAAPAGTQQLPFEPLSTAAECCNTANFEVIEKQLRAKTFFDIPLDDHATGLQAHLFLPAID